MHYSYAYLLPESVAPFTGAWIEIYLTREWPAIVEVAPFTGAWIEIAPP